MLNESTIVSTSFVLSPTLILLLIFCAKSPYRSLYNSNQFSFVLGYDGVVIFIHNQAQCVYLMRVCVLTLAPFSPLAPGNPGKPLEPCKCERAISWREMRET